MALADYIFFKPTIDTGRLKIRQGKMVNSWCDYYIYGIIKTDLTKEEALLD